MRREEREATARKGLDERAMELIVIGLAFVVAALITGYLCHPDTKFYRLDHPNARSLHVNPTPRGGGLGIVIGILVSAVVITSYSIHYTKLYEY